MKKRISFRFPQVLFAAVPAVLMCGCVHSYYSLQPAMEGCGKDGLGVGVVLTEIDTLWVSAEKTIFYPRDFWFCKPRYLGDWKRQAIDTACRFPTVLVEVPFALLNSSFREIPISVESAGCDDKMRGYAHSKTRVALWPLSIGSVAITNNMDCARHGVMIVSGGHCDKYGERSLSMTYKCEVEGSPREILIGDGPVVNWIYFTSQRECFVLREYTSWDACNCSLCGIAIREDYKWPIPFLWRIDLETGSREPIAWFDKGEIVYSSKSAKCLKG